MWVWRQSDGRLSQVLPDGSEKILTYGYAGRAEGKNNPEMQGVRDIGPLPCGMYTLEAPRDVVEHNGVTLRYALPLTPDPENDMLGRSDFLLHGVSAEHPYDSSDGCPVVFTRQPREYVAGSGDNRLKVISGLLEAA